jgi:hypothetical protein
MPVKTKRKQPLSVVQEEHDALARAILHQGDESFRNILIGFLIQEPQSVKNTRQQKVALGCAILKESEPRFKRALSAIIRRLPADCRGAVLVEDAMIYALYFAIFAFSFHHANPWHLMRMFWLAVVHTVQMNSCGACPI